MRWGGGGDGMRWGGGRGVMRWREGGMVGDMAHMSPCYSLLSHSLSSPLPRFLPSLSSLFSLPHSLPLSLFCFPNPSPSLPSSSSPSLPLPPPPSPLPPPSPQPSPVVSGALSAGDTVPADDLSLYQLKWVEWKGEFAPVITQVN